MQNGQWTMSNEQLALKIKGTGRMQNEQRHEQWNSVMSKIRDCFASLAMTEPAVGAHFRHCEELLATKQS
jgi:hypothetical protein